MISGKKKAPPPIVRGRTASVGVAGMYGIPEEGVEEWEGPVGGGLAGEVGAVVTGLSHFKAELLQLHAIVSSSLSSSPLREQVPLTLQLLRNNDGVRDVGGAGGEVGERGAREKQLEEVGTLRDKLSHLQDECTQVTPLVMFWVSS